MAKARRRKAKASQSQLVVVMGKLQCWHTKELATKGGFSHVGIAAHVFGGTVETVTHGQVKAVQNFCRRHRLSVRDFRNIQTRPAVAHARVCMAKRMPATLDFTEV